MLTISVLAIIMAVPGSAQAGGPSGDVRAIHDNGDGTVTVTLYTPAAGVSVDQLYQALRARGVTDLVKPGTDVGALDSFQCYYGTAYALEGGKCPPIRWANNGYARPIVYYRDFSGDQWLVDAAVSDWNQSCCIDAYWIWGNTTQCPGNGKHCVPVYSADYGATTWVGNTSYKYNASSRLFVDGSVYIRLNDHYYRSGRIPPCHEAGHALGVGHNVSLGSCMYYIETTGVYYRPSTDDYLLLEYIIY